nr:hypothetical protein [Tanacetum cinerariifolium]
PLWNDGSLFDSSPKASDGDNQDNDGPNTESEIDNQERPNAEHSTKDINNVGPSINTASLNINTASPTINTVRLSDDFFGADNDMRSLDGVELDISNISTITPYPISFEDDGNGDNVGDDDDKNGDDDENMDDDGGNVNNDVNGDSEDVNEGYKDPNGSNPSFGFRKISLEDFGNDYGLAEKDKAVEENTTEQGTVVEGNEAEEGEIMSTLENFTQWLEKNVDLVREVIDSITAEYLYGDLFGDNSATLESINQGITPEKLLNKKEVLVPKKEL